MQPLLYENPLQLGGIRTATLDDPQPLGRNGCRVALVDTGAGLRFTVALDRGGDIVDAVYHDCALGWLSPNGIKRPGEAYHRGTQWLRSWPGGLLTTCGPMHIGRPSADDDNSGLHGHHSNTPAAVIAIRNPDPARGVDEMSIELSVLDSRMFGPIVEVRRTIRCRLGEAAICIEDEVINRGDQAVPHHLLYHFNFGYPLLAPGARVIARGRVDDLWGGTTREGADAFKRIPQPLAAHAGRGEDGLIIEPTPTVEGNCIVGLVNESRGIGVALSYPAEQLPRLAIWRHLAERSYVVGVEPLYGSLVGVPRDTSALAQPTLQPGESRRYAVDVNIVTGDKLQNFITHDGNLA